MNKQNLLKTRELVGGGGANGIMYAQPKDIFNENTLDIKW